MFGVNIYRPNGVQFGETDYFDTFDEACEFADDMVEDGNYLADIVMPNGKIICVD
jgi:hypothetical protein